MLVGAPPFHWPPRIRESHCHLPSRRFSPQDFVLLKERTLDEAPRPPKKAMDYSSSSEEVESSEDDEEESNGEPSQGSRDTPGARYGGVSGCGGTCKGDPGAGVV